MKLYSFSPIRNENELRKAIDYVATQATALCKKIIGQELPIGYLTIFSHYQDEFKDLESLLPNMGRIEEANNGTLVKLSESIKLPNNKLEKLRIRQPDPYRMQVGCNDFVVSDYNVFKREYLSKHPDNLRLIVRPEYEMIEFFDPDYDVLAYVVSKTEDTTLGQ